MPSKKRPTSSKPPPTLRERAEAAVRATRRGIARMPAEEIQRMVHELQVHQIELEMQNEELRRAQAELARSNATLEEQVAERTQSLRASEERYRHFVHALPAAVYTCDVQGRITLHNAAAVALWGREPKLGRDRWCGSQRIFTPNGRHLPPARSPMAMAVILGEPIRDAELIIERPDGSRAHVLAFSDPLQDSSGALTGAVNMLVDITTLKVTENALLTSERKLRTLSRAVEQSPASVIITSPAGEIEYVNAAFTEVTGYSPEDVLGENPRLLKSGAQPPDLYREMWETITAGRDWRGEFCNRRKSGELFWEYAVIAPIQNEHGTVTHFVAIKEDITERKHAEQEREKLVRLVEHSRDFIAMADLDGRITYMNDGARRMIGVADGQDVRELHFADYVPPHWLDGFRHTALRTARERGLSEGEMQLRHLQTGALIDVFRSTFLIRDPRSGEPWCFATVTRDITADKRATAALRDSRECLSAILNTVGDAIITIDRGGTITGANPATARMFGHTEAEMVGQNVALLMPSPDHEEHDRYLENYQRTGQARIIGIGREVRARRKDGSVFPIDLAVTEVKDMQLYTGVIRDITERKRLEAEVLRITEEERRRVAADLHDGICQELAGIQYISNVLRRDLEKTRHPLAAQARRIEEAIIRTTDQTRQVARGMNPVVADGSGLRHALRQLAEATARTRRIRCSFQCPEPVSIENPTAANELYRIAQQAIQNAVRHSHAKRITVRLSESGGEVCLAVMDNGCGLPADVAGAPGMGLRVMRYRAGLIGGQLAIQPRRRGGTEIICRVANPIAQP